MGSEPACVIVPPGVMALRSSAISLVTAAQHEHGMRAPLVLDFTRVRTMTGAFADELISGLAFRRDHLTLIRMSPGCREEADQVIRRKKLARVTIS